MENNYPVCARFSTVLGYLLVQYRDNGNIGTVPVCNN